MSSPIEEIKERLGVEEVIADYIKLQKAGAGFRAKCPFHADNDPSLHISPDKGVWHCFGCQKGGTICDFVMEIEGIEFPEALRILAQRAGVELRAPSPREETKKNRLLRLNQLAHRYFQEALTRTQGGQAALGYLKKRGVAAATIKQFQLGYAPFSWRGLTNFLRSQGFEERHIVEAGLAVDRSLSQAQEISTEGVRVYDRFRARIMFPIFSSTGSVLGFSGRIFEAALPPEERKKDYGKYINSPNTLIFNKSRVLYGLTQAKAALRKKDEAVFVEGQLDVVLSHQAGVENVVACSGTALTQDHLTVLGRLTKNLVLCFDADSAGERAAREGIKKALSSGFLVKLVALPAGKDPADIIQKSPADWQKYLRKAAPAVEYFMDRAFANFNPETLEGKRQILESIFDILGFVSGPMEKDYYLRKLSERLKEREAVLREELSRFERSHQEIGRDFQKVDNKDKLIVKSAKKDRRYHLEANFLSILLRYPQFGEEMEQGFQKIEIRDEQLAKIFSKLLEVQRQAGWQEKNWQKLFGRQVSLVNELLLRAEFYFNEEKKAKREFNLCLKTFKEFKKKLEIINQITQHV